MSDGLKRRDFLKVVGAGAGGAAVAGCSTGDVDRLIPYVIGDEHAVPSIPTWYASTCRECPAGCGIEVETHSGRVTKVEGNAGHPVSRGNLCARGQASVQGLYHPDRIQGAARVERAVGRQGVTWRVAEQLLADRIREAGPGRTVYLSGRLSGAMARLVSDWVEAVGARHLEYDPFGDQPRDLDFRDADVLVAFGADFLETWGSPVDYAWQLSRLRDRPPERRARFVWVGPHRPLTGLNADTWIAPRPGTEAVLARAIGGQVGAEQAARETGVAAETISALADEFGRGRGVALGPGAALAGPDARALRQAVAALNGTAGVGPAEGAANGGEVVELVRRMRAGEVDVLLVDAPDPVHTLPGGLDFAGAMENVRTRASFSPFPDDTARRCTLLLPNHHFLEQWGDHEVRAGVTSLVQPAMRPVFNTKQTGDVLLSVARALDVAPVSGIEATTFYDYLRAHWSEVHGVGADGWRDALRRGGSFEPAEPGDGEPVEADAGAGEPQAGEEQPADEGTPSGPLVPLPPGGPRGEVPQATDGAARFHLVVYPSHRFYDGRGGNRPWLLEMPDPVTKVAWETVAELHPEAARELGISQGDLLEIESPHGRVEASAYLYPGVRRDAIALQMGLGHEGFGRYSEGRGVNPNRLLGEAIDPDTGEFSRAGLEVAVRPTGRRARFFEGGSRVQHDRVVAQAISVSELAGRDEADARIPGEGERVATLRGRAGFGAARQETDPASGFPTPGGLYGEYVEGATRWAMAIDLDRCTGCSACVTACYAENNIPVVGPREVGKGRDLSWIRIERYWGVSRDEEEALADDATDDTRFLPMLCQHCSNAPCEPVCPVYAAYHTPDGLNAQVYNRCVGTRYCANNCPYKVRVFNWFTYEFEQPLNWQLNPDVTVREKGVMEKCTFCVQRIHEKERAAAREDRPVRDGEVVPACVQTCPSEVFVFGNIADPESGVARAARSTRGYRALDEINVQPAIVYLKKVTVEEPATSPWMEH